MRRKAFTMVEILIVLFIFWVGILGVLSVLTNSLAYFDTISTKTKASFLAKEGLEIAYNFRDSRIEMWLPWNYYTGSCSDSGGEKYLWKNWYNFFKIWYSTGDNPYWLFQQWTPVNAKINFNEAFNLYMLKLYTGDSNEFSYYVYDEHNATDDLPAKGFARYVEFTPINIWWDETLDANRIIKISSHALYKRGTLTWEVVLESFIGMKDTIPANDSCWDI